MEELKQHLSSKLFRLTVGVDRDETARSLGFWMIDQSPYSRAVQAIRDYGYPTRQLAQVLRLDGNAVLVFSGPAFTRTVLLGSRDPTRFAVAGAKMTLLHFAVASRLRQNGNCGLLLYFLAEQPVGVTSTRRLAADLHKLFPTFDLDVTVKQDPWFFGQCYPDVYRFAPVGPLPSESEVDGSALANCTVTGRRIACSQRNVGNAGH